MLYRLAAEAILLLHLAFIVFVITGAVGAARWRWLPLIHLPATAWGVFVELTGRVCPLTTAENYLRTKAGTAGYSESFIEHYFLAIIYPAGLTREIQFALAAGVIAINTAIYTWLLYRHRSARQGDT